MAYGAAKAGVQLLTQDLVAQVGPHGIRANCIAPETILTEKNKAWIPEQQQQQLIQSTRCGGSAPRRASHKPPCTSPQMRQAGSPAWSSTLAAVLSGVMRLPPSIVVPMSLGEAIENRDRVSSPARCGVSCTGRASWDFPLVNYLPVAPHARA